MSSSKLRPSLQNLALGHLADGLGEAGEDLAVSVLDQRPAQDGIEEIADEHGFARAEAGVGARPAAPHAGLVDHVVVQQRGAVQPFGAGRDPNHPRTRASEQLGA